MDPRSGTPSFPDPAVTTVSQVRSTHPENAELLSREPSRPTSGAAVASLDPSSCPNHESSKSVHGLAVSKQLPDASSALPSSSKPSVDRQHKASPNRKTHHSPTAENRSSVQKSSHQSNRPSAQSRNVQWVRVSPQSQKVSDSSPHNTGNSGKHFSGSSSSTSEPQIEGSSSSDMSQHTSSSSLMALEKQTAEDVEVIDEYKTGSSTEVRKNVELLPSVSKESPHDPLFFNHSVAQEVTQDDGASAQSRNVQWVRVSPQSQKVSDSSPHNTGNSGKHVSGSSLSTSEPQIEGSSSSDMSQPASSSSLVALEKQTAEDVEVLDEYKTGSSTEVRKNVEPLPSVSKESPHDALFFNHSVAQEVTQDDGAPGLVTQDVEVRVAGLAAEATDDNGSSASEFCLTIEEQPVLSAMDAGCTEDEELCETQHDLSRSSSLSARAREFVPKSATPPPAAPTLPPQPLQPPQMRVVRPALMIPINAVPGILPMFPPSSPVPSPQLRGFPLTMTGPPPPPIPASIMGPIPLLGPAHPRLLSMGPPPPPVIPLSPYLIHSPSSSVPVAPQFPSAPSADLGNQPEKEIGEILQEQHQSQELDLSDAQPGLIQSMPTEDLRAKIVKQVEFYFSDTNLPTDHHLMKFVKKDPEGFVPISIVANFRKVRNLTKKHSVVATALCSSKQLVVSSDCKRVRRLHPLPHVDLEEIQSRTVVAENLPPNYSIESMQQLFGGVGKVKMVRICEPEAVNGAYQAKISKADMVVSNKLHALVEYETVEQAERAVSELTDEGNWRRGLSVRLLLRRTTKHAPKSHKLNDGADGSATEDDVTTSYSDNFVERPREEDQVQERPDDFLGGDHCQIDALSKKGRGRGRGRGRERVHHPNGGRSHPVGTPPLANSVSSFEPKPPLGPRMPDGTRGFTLGRGKGVPTNSVNQL